MALRTLYAFLGAMVCITLFLTSQEQYSFSFKPEDTKAAQVVLREVKNFEITPEGVQSITTAKTLERFLDYDVLTQAEVLVRQGLHVSFLRAQTALLKGQSVYLKKDVYFARTDAISFESDEAIYHRDTKVLEGNSPFVARQGPHRSVGKTFVYDTQKGELQATSVHAFLETEKQ